MTFSLNQTDTSHHESSRNDDLQAATRRLAHTFLMFLFPPDVDPWIQWWSSGQLPRLQALTLARHHADKEWLCPLHKVKRPSSDTLHLLCSEEESPGFQRRISGPADWFRPSRYSQFCSAVYGWLTIVPWLSAVKGVEIRSALVLC